MGQGGPAAQTASKPPRLRGHGPPVRRVRRALDRPSPRRLSGGSHGGFRQLVLWSRPATSPSYWASRNSRLRNTVERKERALFRAHRASVEILESPAQTARAIDLYQRVHAESWKEPEPYPNFIPSLIATGLDAGAVRVGILMVDDEPVAAQLWIVWNRRATIFKLSYAEQFARFSPGSILTRHMMRDAFSRGGLAEIDFGCGDDPYKQEWLPERRQRWMITAYDPLSPAGRPTRSAATCRACCGGACLADDCLGELFGKMVEEPGFEPETADPKARAFPIKLLPRNHSTSQAAYKPSP